MRCLTGNSGDNSLVTFLSLYDFFYLMLPTPCNNPISDLFTDLPRDSCFEHEIIWYGLEALLHKEVFGKIKRNKDEGLNPLCKIPVDYHTNGFDRGLGVHLKFLEQEGIIIPKIAYDIRRRREHTVVLFQTDYKNRYLLLDDDNLPKMLAYSLIERHRELRRIDLDDHNLIIDAQCFAKDMWQRCMHDFCIHAGQGRDLAQHRLIARYYDEYMKD